MHNQIYVIYEEFIILNGATVGIQLREKKRSLKEINGYATMKYEWARAIDCNDTQQKRGCFDFIASKVTKQWLLLDQLG